MSSLLTPDPAAARLAGFLDRTIEQMMTEALRVPPEPVNVPTFVEIGKAIAGLDALRSVLQTPSRR